MIAFTSLVTAVLMAVPSAQTPSQPAARANPPSHAAPAAQQPQKPEPQQPATKSAASTAKASTATTNQPTAEQIREAQQRLIKLGLYKGAVTGRMSPDFTASIRTFQKHVHLKDTGVLDEQTMVRLHPKA